MIPERPPILPERGPNLPERQSYTERMTTITERHSNLHERPITTDRGSNQAEKSVTALVNSYQQRVGAGPPRDVNRNSTSWHERERQNNNYQNVETTVYSTSDAGQLLLAGLGSLLTVFSRWFSRFRTKFFFHQMWLHTILGYVNLFFFFNWDFVRNLNITLVVGCWYSMPLVRLYNIYCFFFLYCFFSIMY